MPDISAAIIVLAGAVLIVARILPSPLTDITRQRIIGLGFLIALLGLAAWIVAFVLTFTKFVNAM